MRILVGDKKKTMKKEKNENKYKPPVDDNVASINANNSSSLLCDKSSMTSLLFVCSRLIFSDGDLTIFLLRPTNNSVLKRMK